MQLDRFLRIAELAGNTTWVHTYLASFPGQLVLEVANIEGADLSRLRADLLAEGFEDMGTHRRNGVEMARWAARKEENRD